MLRKWNSIFGTTALVNITKMTQKTNQCGIVSWCQVIKILLHKMLGLKYICTHFIYHQVRPRRHTEQVIGFIMETMLWEFHHPIDTFLLVCLFLFLTTVFVEIALKDLMALLPEHGLPLVWCPGFWYPKQRIERDTRNGSGERAVY